MAAKEEVAPAGEAPKKGKKLLLIVVTLGVVLVLVAALALWVLLSLNKDDGEGGDEEEVQEVAGGHAGASPIYVALDPFTVNLARTPPPPPDSGGMTADGRERLPSLTVPDDGDRYMQATVSLEVASPDADAAIKARMPRIRNNVTLIMSGKTATELMTSEGKKALAKEIRDDINRVLNPSAKGKKANGPVIDVLFPAFIIQ
ncbi:MAG: flagellar basal body-associated FliL family protein [Zoogloeaceae bacterium]|jgi:flagellar FliL protein|nr:flagellar basal body-associated FliL family protein [Zoogloeaceae bacterium]